MHTTRSSSLLRLALSADAVVSGVTGLAMWALAVPLESFLGVPASLLRAAGLGLLPFVAVVAYLATREPGADRRGVRGDAIRRTATVGRGSVRGLRF